MTPVRGMHEAMRAEARAQAKRRFNESMQSVLGSLASAQSFRFLHPSAKVAADAMTDSMRYQMAAAIAWLDADAAVKFLKDTLTEDKPK